MNASERRSSRLTRNDPTVDLRWWLVPVVLVLLVLAALLSWPQMSTRRDGDPRLASPPPRHAASVALAGAGQDINQELDTEEARAPKF